MEVLKFLSLNTFKSPSLIRSNVGLGGICDAGCGMWDEGKNEDGIMCNEGCSGGMRDSNTSVVKAGFSHFDSQDVK